MASNKPFFKTKKSGYKYHGILRVHVVTHRSSAFLFGVATLCNVKGGYDHLDGYMRGDFVTDMRADWMNVGQCLRESMLAIKK